MDILMVKYLVIVLLFLSATVHAATWSIVQSSWNNLSGSFSVISTTFTSNTTAGNLVVIFAEAGNNVGTISSVKLGSTNLTQAPNAYTQGPADAGFTDIWYLENCPSGEKVITVNFAAAYTFNSLFAREVSGIKTISSFDVATSTNFAGHTTNPFGPVITTTAQSDFIISGIDWGAGSISAVQGGNEFTYDDGTLNTSGSCHITSTSASLGTHQPQWADASSTDYCASAAAFFVAAGSPIEPKSLLFLKGGSTAIRGGSVRIK